MSRAPITSVTWTSHGVHPFGIGVEWRSDTGCRAIVGREPSVGWHISVSHPDRYPTWDELAEIRDRAVADDVALVMAFPHGSGSRRCGASAWIGRRWPATTLHLWEDRR